MLSGGRPGSSYNLGGDSERTNIQVVDAICAALERIHPAASNEALAAAGVARYEELKSFVPDRLGHDRRYAMDARKIREELGWEPEYDTLESIIESAWEWHRSHPKGYDDRGK